MPSFYVKRKSPVGRVDGYNMLIPQTIGWTGPIHSERQADREAKAWLDCGWTAEVVPSTPEVRKQIRVWERNRNTPREVVGRCQHCGVRQFNNPNTDPALDSMAHLCWKCVKPWKA
jgi:hypothetical protein